MEHVSGAVSVAVTAMLIGMVGILVARKRKHLKLVVRVVDQKDQKLIGFLDHLIESGQLSPVPAN